MSEKEVYLGYTTDKALTPFFRQFLTELDSGTLNKSKCTKCGAEYLPPREHCQKCLSVCELTPHKETEAKLLSYVIVDFAPETMSSRAPYVVAIGEFPSGLRLTAHITNLMDMPTVGMPLKLGIEKVDDKKVTYKWQV
ncbi:MAG: OB-fold domain-containing protein [Candidatus Thorarchaeota archaeon]|nr:OB-fold domain-containing protein [Candidatus Thorarchaeota archaeon]